MSGILAWAVLGPMKKVGVGENMRFSQCLTQDPCEETITIPVVMTTRSIGETLLEERQILRELELKDVGN